METEKIENPTKAREHGHHLLDSTVWNEFKFRDDDIIINGYAKTGTTWVQQIVAQLFWNGAEQIIVSEVSPWLDCRFPAQNERLASVAKQPHRRFLKSHLPVDTLVFSEQAKYIYIGRDGRDVAWSLYHHHRIMKPEVIRDIDSTPERTGSPLGPAPASVLAYYRAWLEQDGHPWWPFWEHVRSWWAIKDLSNVMLLHHAKLKADLPGEIQRIAAFLEIDVDETKWRSILEHCSFEYMKMHAERSVPFQGAIFTGGAKAFIHKGTNRRWQVELTSADMESYERLAEAKLGQACANWLLTGAYPENETPNPTSS